MTDHNSPMPPILPDATATAPAEATFTPAPAEEPRGNVALGIVAGLGLGVAAAVVYALVARFTDREIGWLAFLIGFGVAFGIVRVGKSASVVLGLVAALLSGVLFIVAVFGAGALIIANEYGAPVMDAMNVLLDAPVDFLKLYFEDFLSYVFLGLAVVPAFLTASGLRNRNA